MCVGVGRPQPDRVLAEVTLERAAKDARKLAKAGEFRRAVQRLELACMAPPTPETVEALRALHPPANEAVEVLDPPPAEELDEAPLPVDVQREYFEAAVAGLPNGSAPGPSQLRYEHLRVVHRGGGGDILFLVVRQLAAGTLPAEARPWFGAARLVALLKDRDEASGAPIPPRAGGSDPLHAVRCSASSSPRPSACRRLTGSSPTSVLKRSLARWRRSRKSGWRCQEGWTAWSIKRGSSSSHASTGWW